MTSHTEIREGLTGISNAIATAMRRSCESEKPYVRLTSELDQIRAFIDQMAAAITDPGAAAPGLVCFGCILQRHAAEAAGVPAAELPPVAVAEFVVEGRSLARCHLQLQNGPVIPGRTAGGLILGGG